MIRQMDVFFLGFLTWIMKESRRLKLHKLYFFTREGEFFKFICDEITRYVPVYKNILETELIEVSRMSTFLPSIRDVSITEFMRIWRQYPVQSMEALFCTLQIEIHEASIFLEKYGISQTEDMPYLWRDKRIQRLFHDQDFICFIEEKRDYKRRLLYKYLKQKGWERDRKDMIGIVDIGWKGSIQDNLCFLYPDYKIVGFYIGLQPFLSPQPLNARKFGYIDSHKLKDRILLTVTPLEMLCNSPNGSTAGYAEKKGKVYAVRKKDGAEEAVYDKYTKREQAKIISRIRQRMKKMERGAFPYCEKKAQRMLYRYIAYPDRSAVKAYFALNHNDEFGKGMFVKRKAEIKPMLFFRAAVSRNGRRELKERLKATAWPQGVFVRYRLNVLLPIYNILLAGYMKKKKKAPFA